MSQYERNCPQCNSLIVYQSNSGFWLGKKKNSKCRKCSSKDSGFIDRYATKGKNTGSDNAFFGQNHSAETIEKIKDRDGSAYRTDEFREKMSKVTSGDKNPMYGKTIYEIWVEKYGEEEAKQKELDRKEKLSKASSGKNNPMYGKPAPNGAGNGWKGWFQNKFFRSLRELCFMIWLLESKLEWSTGEAISISYIDSLGHDRTYRPDFLVGNKIYEIKPTRLIDSPNNQLKMKALKKYCKKHNLTYEIKDIEIDNNKIQQYIDTNDIKFNGDYLERFKKYQK